MDDLIDDIEAGIAYTPHRQSNKKMKKRKQLDALLKFRSKKSSGNVRSSEDELFLPNQKSSPPKRSSRSQRCCSYTRHILSFCLVCIFMIVCVGLAYANIELKNEVQNLSSRVTEIENHFSTSEINRVISTIEQMKTRLNLLELWNVSYIYERLQKIQGDLHQINKRPTIDETSMNSDAVDVSSKLKKIEQKSTQFSAVATELDKLNHDADTSATDVMDEKTKISKKDLLNHLLAQEQSESAYQDAKRVLQNILSLNESFYANTAKWNQELQTFRSELQTIKANDLTKHFEELTGLVHNSSNQTSMMLTSLQTGLEKLRSQVEACKCLKESVRLKPSIVQTDQLQQSIITKPNPVSSTTLSSPVSDKADHNNNTIDIAQVVNQPLSSTTPPT